MAKAKITDFSSANEERMNSFFMAVNSEVTEETEKIIAEGIQEKEQIIKEADEESLQRAYKQIQHSAKKSADKYELIANKSELDIKKSILKYRTDLVDKMFDDVRKRLAEFRSSPEYAGYLKKLLKSEKLEDGVVINLGSADMKYSEELQKEAGVKVSFKEDALIKLGGLSVFYPDKSVIIDKSIDMALLEEKKAFATSGKFIISE